MTDLLTDPAVEVEAPAPPAWRTVSTLARRESRLLLRHPATRVGLALAALAWLLIWTESTDSDVLFDPSNDFPFPLVLFAFGLLIAANLASLRARRSAAEELFESLPMPAGRRTLAHVLTSIAGVALSAVVFAVALVAWQSRPGTIGQPPVQVVAVLLLLVAGGIVTGVLVAEWLPHAAVGAASVVALIVLQSNFGHESETWQWLHFLPQEFSGVFDVGPIAWHIPYLAALVVLGGALAVARHGWTRPVAMVLAGSLAVISTAGWVQTRPLQASALARQADRLQNPVAHQSCEQRGGVRYCSYPAYAGWIDLWRAPVDGVRALLPAVALGRVVEVHQRTPANLDLQPSVQRLVDPARAWPADGLIHPGIEWVVGAHDLALAYQVAARAVGLPTVSSADQTACSAGGQARGVVAFWLAGQGGTPARDELADRVADIVEKGRAGRTQFQVANAVPDWENHYADDGGDWVPELGSGARGADLEAAAALLRLDRDRVRDVVHANWAALRDPSTSGVDLFRLVGTAPPAGYAALAPVRPGVGRSCT